LDIGDRICFNLFYLLLLVPFNFLWIRAMKPFQRTKLEHYYIFYVISLISFHVLANMWNWPYPLTISGQQTLLIMWIPVWVGLAVMTFGHFFAQVFMIGVLAALMQLILGIPMLLKMVPELDAVTYYTWGTVSLIVVWSIIYRRCRDYLEEVFDILCRSASERIWRLVSVLPFSIFVVSVACIILYTDGNMLELKTFIVRPLAFIGVLAMLHIIGHIGMLMDSGIMTENLPAAHESYQLYQRQFEREAMELRRVRMLRHDLRHYCLELRSLLSRHDWDRFIAIVDECGKRVEIGGRGHE